MKVIAHTGSCFMQNRITMLCGDFANADAYASYVTVVVF